MQGGVGGLEGTPGEFQEVRLDGELGPQAVP